METGISGISDYLLETTCIYPIAVRNSQHRMDFHELERRFLEHLRARVRSGELTERHLARITGVSQPHIHNVLKGKRTLSANTADVILHILHLDLLDFIRPEELAEKPRIE
jgi:transcriptional regulator with XRE-family HTH domain